MRNPKLSIVLPSYLGEYRNAARNRPDKLRRAIQSVKEQSFQDYELIIISDGCDLTDSICLEELKGMEARLIRIDKQPLFSGIPRNEGIRASRGEYICYLDNDDAFSIDHLEVIARNLQDKPWYFFNDLVWKKGRFEERECKPILYQCGTSNIAHKNIGVYWEEYNKYGSDDWIFIRKLLYHPWERIETPGYLVCHIPNHYDV